MFGADKYRSWMQRPVLEKKDNAAPDYTPLANASKESAEIMAGLGREQLGFARSQYNDMKPLFDRIVAQQIRIGDESAAQAREDRRYMIDTFRPIEQGLAKDVADFNTDAYRNQLAAQAAADAGRAFGSTQAATARAMASMGVNPNSGKAMAMQNQNALALAAMRSNAMTGTRRQAEQMGYARQVDMAGLGRGLVGASQGANQLAIGAGNSAGQNAMAPGNQYMAGMGQGANTIGSGRTMLQSGLGNVLNAQTGVYKADAASGLDVGGLMQGAAAMYSSGIFSDRRLKEDIVAVGVDESTGLTVYEFKYINGGDTRYRGVMADEVESYMPDAVSYDDLGYASVNYGMLGIEMVEV